MEARDIVQRLCDDRRMQAQIAAAIDERLRADGPHVLGDRLVAHATAQKAILPPAFYNSYYKVLSEYLEEINYGGTQAATSTGLAPGRGLARQAPTPLAVAPSLQTVPSPPALIGSNGGTPARSRKERLAELKELRDDGTITQDEFDTRRKEILAEV